MAYISVTRPVITLDQVKHKADEIKEGRRHSLTDGCDAKKFQLSVVDETVWQAAERSVTPMWEIATTTSGGVTSNPANVDSQFLHHDIVSGQNLLFIHS
jgi:hypothetical protein